MSRCASSGTEPGPSTGPETVIPKHLRFEQLVFSGGGTRCFWQGGFLNIVRDVIKLEPDRISAVSGGALGAAAYIAHRGHALLSIMSRRFARNASNIGWHEVDPDTGLTPHQRIYREVAEETLTDRTISDVINGPQLQILIGHPPGGKTGTKLTGTAATLAYEAELHLINAPHFNWAEKCGVTSTLVDANKAARDGGLIDLVCAAAVIPPLFDLPEWDGTPVIDGGMADQAPMPDPDHGRTLVLLTRAYSRLPEIEGRLYLWPQRDRRPTRSISPIRKRFR